MVSTRPGCSEPQMLPGMGHPSPLWDASANLIRKFATLVIIYLNKFTIVTMKICLLSSLSVICHQPTSGFLIQLSRS